MHKRIFGEFIPFDLELDMEQFRSKVSNTPLESFSIDELRGAREILYSQSNKMDNKNPALKFYTVLMYSLSVEERSRPISEQFPYARCDIDSLVKATENLEKSTRRIDQTLKNKSDEMGIEVRRVFLAELIRNEWDAEIMTEIIGGIIFSLTKPKVELVQWDGIITAVHKSGSKKIFFIETKEIANEADIFRQGDGLFDRAKRTYEYLQQLQKGELPKGATYTEAHRKQHRSFRDLSDYNVTIAYVSSVVDDKIKSLAFKVETDFQLIHYPIYVWVGISPRLNNISFITSLE